MPRLGDHTKAERNDYYERAERAEELRASRERRVYCADCGGLNGAHTSPLCPGFDPDDDWPGEDA